ncbi:MAG: protein kinase domain-containing protein [Actinopolymorphaceae bacterium]
MEALEQGDPRAIGQCRIQARIATGGMANVYLGRSAGGRAVAVKVMHADFAGQPDYTERFRREVAALRAVGGGHNPSLLDADADAEVPWLATEFLPSVTLREAVRMAGGLTARTVWSLAAGVAEAMAAIHRAGFVHLDLTPANVMLTADGPRVIDFGIARELDPHGVASTGSPAGSHGFMAPEQLAGGLVGPKSDVYSYGAMLTYACTGRGPGVGAGSAGAGEVADDDLRGLIACCLHDDPSARPSVSELIGELGVSARDGGTSGRLALPPVVTTAIARSAGEARNPPAESPLPTPREGEAAGRSRVATWAVLAAVVAVVVVVTAAAVGIGSLLSGDPEREPTDSLGSTSEPSAPRPTPKSPSPTASPTPSNTPTPSATPTPRVLEFRFTGSGTLTNLTYIVNGRSTTVKNVKLPWRRSLDLPQAPERFEWQLAYEVSGTMEYRVLQDGKPAGSGWSTGGNGTAGGTLSFRPSEAKADG